jgi:hypothetical protein
MKKIILLSIFLSVFMGTTIFAEETSVSTTTDVNTKTEITATEKKAILKARVEADKKMIKEKIASSTTNIKIQRADAIEKASQKERLQERKATIDLQRSEMKRSLEARVNKQFDDVRKKIARGYDRVIKNLINLVERIESRITKIESTGIDVSVSKDLLIIAETDIAVADTEITILAELLTKEISSENRREIITELREQADKTRKALQTARISILDTIKSLPKVEKKVKMKTASSTEESN